MKKRINPCKRKVLTQKRTGKTLSAFTFIALSVMSTFTTSESVSAQETIPNLNGETIVDVALASQPLENALKQLANQIGKQIVFFSEDVRGLTAKAIRGKMTEKEALQSILNSDALVIRYVNENTIAVLHKRRLENKAAPIDEELKDAKTIKPSRLDDRVVIVARREDLEEAIELKRNANQIIDTITSSDTGRLPDNNIAETLTRIAGVSVRRDGESGNGDSISIRGLDSSLNNLQFDGVNSGQAEVGTRSTPLDGIATDNIAELRVKKSLLPEDDGEGIGGSVQVISKTPLRQSTDSFFVDLQGRHSEFANKTGHRAQLSFNKIISDNFGASLSVSSRRRFIRNYELDAVSSNLAFVPEIFDANGNAVSNEFILEELDSPGSSFDNVTPGFIPSEAVTFEQQSYQLQDQIRDTLTINGAIDWRISENTLLTFSGRFSEQDTTASEYSLAFDADDDEFQEINGVLTTIFDDPEIDFTAQIEDRLASNQSYFIRGNTQFDNLTLDYQVSFARATDNQPQHELAFDTDSLLDPDEVNFLPFENVNEFFPLPNQNVLNNADFNNAINDFAGTQQLDDFTLQVKDSRKNDRFALKFDGDYAMDSEFLNGSINTVKFGMKYEKSDVRDEFIVINGEDTLNLDGTFNLDEDGDAAGEALETVHPDLFGGLSSTRNIGNPLSAIGLNGIPTLNEGVFRQLISDYLDSYTAQGGSFEDSSDFLFKDFFEAEETITAAYTQFEYEAGNLQVIGGVRVEHYKADFRSPIEIEGELSITNLVDPADDSSAVTEEINLAPRDLLDEITTSTSNVEILPRLNALYKVSDTFQIRSAIGRSIARPSFGQLGDAASIEVVMEVDAGDVGDTPILAGIDNLSDVISAGGLTTEQLDAVEIEISSGNPDLKNAQSWNADLSFEYYPFKGTSVSLGLFYKRIDNFIFTGEESDEGGLSVETVDALLQPDGFIESLLFDDSVTLIDQLGGLDTLSNAQFGELTIRQPRNGDRAEVWGLELGFNHLFSWAPGYLSNVGVSGNVSFTDSKANFELAVLEDDDALVVLGYANEGDVLFRETSFFNAPDLSANGTLFYESDGIEVAFSASYQSEVFDSADDFGLDQYAAAYFQLDFFMGYDLRLFDQTGDFSLFFEVQDITDSGEKPTDLQTIDRNSSVYDEASFNGREFILGFRGRF